MFFNPKKTSSGLLQIDEEFATLIDASESESSSSDLRNQSLAGEMTFLFKFKISQIKALEQNALAVAITVKSSVKDRPVIFSKADLSAHNRETVINNIIQYRNKIDNINQKDKESFILRKVGDVTSKVNNQLLNAIKTNQPIDDVGVKKNKLIIKKVDRATANDTLKYRVSPINAHASLQSFSIERLQEIGFKNSGGLLRKLYHNLLFVKGKPTTDIFDAQDRTKSTFESTQGILKHKKIEEFVGNPTTEIVNSLLFSGQGKSKNEEYITTFETKIDEFVVVDSIVKFRQEQTEVHPLFIVKFDLLQTKTLNNGSKRTFVLESITKNLDIQKHVNAFFYAKKAPIVNFSKTNDKIILSIQNEKMNTSEEVAIFKKTINSGATSSFNQVKKATLKNGANRIELKNYNDNLAIYRIIPVSSLAGRGFDFTDIVVRGDHKHDKKLSVIPTLTSRGVKVAAYKDNPLIKSAGLLIKDVTLRQSQFLHIENFVFGNDESYAETLISNLTPNHTYEFSARLYFENGETFDSINTTFFEFLPYEGNALNVQITNLSKNVDSAVATDAARARQTSVTPDPRFTVRATFLQDQIGRFKFLSDSLSKTFDQETINNNKSIFDKLILFEIVRYNKTTGDVENLGIISNNDTFVDSERSSAFLAKRAAINNEYVYVLNPLLREPSSLLEGEKEIKDTETGKKYKFNPTLKLHPLNLKKGLSASKSFLEERAKDEALYGKIGATYTLELSYKKQRPVVTNFEAVLMGANRAYLKWNFQEEDASSFDHFIILKEIEKVRTIIGKSHALSGTSNFIYEITKNDVGLATFLLIPVYDDYYVGEPIYSNQVLIES
jgi:hypothetical protein